MNQRLRIIPCIFLAACACTSAQQFQPSCPLPFDTIKVGHEIDQSCPNEGVSNSSAAKKAEARAKNNFCASAGQSTQPTKLSFDAFERLQEAANGMHIGADRSGLKNLLTVHHSQV